MSRRSIYLWASILFLAAAGPLHAQAPDDVTPVTVDPPDTVYQRGLEDIDPGIAATRDDYSLERYILGTDHYQIELLTNLDQVPEAGALVVVSFPKPKGGSGFPARVFAILPEEED